MVRARTSLLIVAILAASAYVPACALSDVSADGGDHDEPADYEVGPADGKADGVPAVFNQNDVVGDDVFLNDGAMDVAAVQAFLEDSPYGNRSWLADYSTAGGTSAAQAVIAAATQEGIAPLVLLARMQVESSLVGKSARPSQGRINAIMGCGCPDGGGCSAQYQGFDKQLVCSAKTLRRWYDASDDGTGEWRKGSSRRTLDNKLVTPANHATASLYSYTPWVLPGRGGAWLVWNVTRKYVRFADDQGLRHATPIAPTNP